METKFTEKMLKKDLVALGQYLEKEMLSLQEKNKMLAANNKKFSEELETGKQSLLVLEEKNKALVARNKGLATDLEIERGRTAGLRTKTANQEKDIYDLNVKLKGLEGKITDMGQDWLNDTESATKQIQVLTAELKAANNLCDSRATSINALKAENANLTKANNRGNYINLFLGGVVLFLFMYICWRM